MRSGSSSMRDGSWAEKIHQARRLIAEQASHARHSRIRQRITVRQCRHTSPKSESGNEREEEWRGAGAQSVKQARQRDGREVMEEGIGCSKAVQGMERS